MPQVEAQLDVLAAGVKSGAIGGPAFTRVDVYLALLWQINSVLRSRVEARPVRRDGHAGLAR